MTIQVGTRVSVQNKGNGTVRWIGTLEGLESVRVGIELDSAFESCHSGEYLEKSYFACKPKCGIFLKVDKVNSGKSFMEALIEKYVKSGHGIIPPERQEGIPIVELVGKEKAETFFASNVFDLNEISLDGMEISSLTCDENFTQLEALSLRKNLISNLGDILNLCLSLPTVRNIDLSGNVFSIQSECSVPTDISHVVMNDCSFVTVEQLNAFLACCQRLTKLSLNRSNIVIHASLRLPVTLQSVSLQGLKIDSWGAVDELVKNLPMLRHLDISENSLLGNINTPILVDNLVHLESFSIVSCEITEWSTIRILSEKLPNLKSIHLTENPVYENSNSAKRQLIIFAFPNLCILNNTTISQGQRAEAQRYIITLLSRSGDANAWMWEALSEAKRKEIVQMSSQEPQDEPTLVTARRRLTVNLSLKMPTGEFIPIKVPCECRSSDLHALVVRKSKWPLKPSELRVSISPTLVSDDMIPIDSITDISQVGASDGWYVFTALVES